MGFFGDLYDNLSEKFKILGIVGCVLVFILMVILAICYFILSEVLIGIILLILSPIIAYVAGLTNFAIGTHLENQQAIIMSNNRIYRLLKDDIDNKNKKDINDNSDSSNTEARKEEPKEEALEPTVEDEPLKDVVEEATKDVDVKEEKQEDIGKPIYVDEERIKCPKCGKTQRNDRASCYSCGYRFKQD